MTQSFPEYEHKNDISAENGQSECGGHSKWFGLAAGVQKQTAQAPKNLCGYGRGSKFRTHGTRFWRPLLYQLSYTPIGIR